MQTDSSDGWISLGPSLPKIDPKMSDSQTESVVTDTASPTLNDVRDNGSRELNNARKEERMLQETGIKAQRGAPTSALTPPSPTNDFKVPSRKDMMRKTEQFHLRAYEKEGVNIFCTACKVLLRFVPAVEIRQSGGIPHVEHKCP